MTMGLVSLLMTKPDLKPFRERLGLNETSVIYLINTEGDTDPDGFYDIVYNGAHPIA